jgi:hypothetical protein
MSSLFNMRVIITKHDESKEKEIIAAANEEWNFDDEPETRETDYYGKPDHQLILSGNSYLGGGEVEQEFADRLAVAIYKANGKFCGVLVISTYLEELPTEEFKFELKDYRRLMKRKKDVSLSE